MAGIKRVSSKNNKDKQDQQTSKHTKTKEQQKQKPTEGRDQARVMKKPEVLTLTGIMTTQLRANMIFISSPKTRSLFQNNSFLTSSLVLSVSGFPSPGARSPNPRLRTPEAGGYSA